MLFLMFKTLFFLLGVHSIVLSSMPAVCTPVDRYQYVEKQVDVSFYCITSSFTTSSKRIKHDKNIPPPPANACSPRCSASYIYAFFPRVRDFCDFVLSWSNHVVLEDTQRFILFYMCVCHVFNILLRPLCT